MRPAAHILTTSTFCSLVPGRNTFEEGRSGLAQQTTNWKSVCIAGDWLDVSLKNYSVCLT